jgi:cytochrome c oxidase subunit 2
MSYCRALRAHLALCACLAWGAAQAASGSQLFATCVACHGGKGEGVAATSARRHRRPGWGLSVRQLQNFRSGVRGAHKADSHGAQMRSIAATLPDDAAVARVAAYVAGLPKPIPWPTVGADLRNGNNLYQGKCGACHGTQAEGNVSLSTPRLAGLDAAYLRRQYQNFAAGVRGAQPQDRYGKQMAMMSNSLASPKGSRRRHCVHPGEIGARK